MKTPLKKVANMTPTLVIEFEALGYHALEDLQKAGWEKICLAYSKKHPSKFTSEFFTLIYAIVNDIPLKKVTKEVGRKIQRYHKKIKAGSEAGFAKKSRKKVN